MLNARLSHVSLRTNDIVAARRFYADNVGLRPGVAAHGRERLSLAGGTHVLELSTGDGLDHFALEVPDEDALAELERRLAENDVKASWTDPGADHARALVFDDPDGHRIELHGRVERAGEGTRMDGRCPIGIHHITITTPDVPALVEFYTDVLGFEVSDRMQDKFVWLRCNREHHTVAVVEGLSGGLDHYCFEVADWDDLKAWCDQLAIRDVPLTWGPGRHGPGNNLFIMFDDADGVHVELSCEIERFWDDRVKYGEPRNWSAELRTVNLWGPAPDWRRPIESPSTA